MTAARAPAVADRRNPGDAAELAIRLRDTGRKPIVGVSEGGPSHRGWIDAVVLARRLGDAAEVCLLSAKGLATLPPSLNVGGGAVRVWFPGVDETAGADHAREHPVFVAQSSTEVEATIERIVECVRRRESSRPRLLRLRGGRDLVEEAVDLAAVVAAIKDEYRRDALIVVCKGVLDKNDRTPLAREIGAAGRVYTLNSDEDAEQLTAALPSELGLPERGIRVWWPGVGTRSTPSVHCFFPSTRATSSAALCSRVASFVRLGLEPPVLLRPDGSSEPLTTDALANVLLDPDRRRIVVGIAPDASEMCVDPRALADRIGVAADIVVVPNPQASARLAAALPDAIGAMLGGIRVWLPGLTWMSSPDDHPVFKNADGWSADLVDATWEAVLRRLSAPALSDPSDVGALRQRVQRQVHRHLDRLGNTRYTKAHETALALTREAARLGQTAEAVAAFRDAWELIRWSIRARHGAGSATEVFGLGDFARGTFELGQTCGGSLRPACFEQALDAYEEALRLGRALDANAAADAGVSLYWLRSNTAGMCHYVAQRRAEASNLVGAEEVVRRGLDLCDELLTEVLNPLKRAWTLHRNSMLVKELGRHRIMPRLAAEEAALALIRDAVTSFVGETDYSLLDRAVVSRGEEDSGKPVLLASALLHALADTHIETGEHDLAVQSFVLLDGYGDLGADGEENEYILRASLRRGRLELDHGDFWRGVARLERELARVDLRGLGTRAHGEAVNAICALAAVLEKQGARRESEFYFDWAARLGKRAGLPAEAEARRAQAAADTTSEDEISTGQPTREECQASADELARRIVTAVETQYVHHTVTNLRSAAHLLQHLARREAAGEPLTLDLADLCAALDMANDWSPRRRTPKNPNVPAEWYVLPADLGSDLGGAIIACLLLALQFADRYAPGLVPGLLLELHDRVIDRQGRRRENRWLAAAAAERAKALGRWDDAVRGCLEAARAADSPEAAIALAHDASEQLRRRQRPRAQAPREKRAWRGRTAAADRRAGAGRLPRNRSVQGAGAPRNACSGDTGARDASGPRAERLDDRGTRPVGSDYGRGGRCGAAR